MKKTFIAVLAIVLAVGFGTAFANGITDYSGAPQDIFAITPSDGMGGVGVHESSAAGSLREADGTRYNGVTDFDGNVYDRFDLEKAGGADTLESSAAGSLRIADSGLDNGVTDFKGDTYDRF